MARPILGVLGAVTLLAVGVLAQGQQTQPSKEYIRLGSRVIAIENFGAPSISSLSPALAVAGATAFTLTVNGTGFTSTSVVQWNTSGRSTTFVSTTQLTASISAADVANSGTVAVTVATAATGGTVSKPAVFTINDPVPTVGSLSPNVIAPGSNQLTLTVNGTNFLPTSVVRWNGSARATHFSSPTVLFATILASDVQTAGNASVTVLNPAPGGGASNAMPVAITNPIPVLNNISPSQVTVGAAGVTLTVGGSNFVSSSVVQWNGTALQTTFTSSSSLTALVPATNVAVVGSASVTVVNGPPGGGTSGHLPFTISSPPPGYLYSAMITIHGQNSSGPQSNFPVLISNTYAFLATVPGGSIFNLTQSNNLAVPADLIFTQNADGSQPLSWEIAAYNASTGLIQAWVKIPTLSNTGDTVIYMFYGNSSVTTYQGNPNNTIPWDSNFIDVYHFEAHNQDVGSIVYDSVLVPVGNQLQPRDSLGYNDQDQAIGIVSGEIGNAFHFGQFLEYSNSGNASLPTQQAARTIETWFKLDAGFSGTTQYLGGWGGTNINVDGTQWSLIYNGNNTLGVETRNGGAFIPWNFDTSWHHLAVTSAAGNSNPANATIYLDGSYVPISSWSGTIATTSQDLVLGANPDAGPSLRGTLDEFRISSIDRSATWIALQYSNETNPIAFYSFVVSPNPVPTVTTLSPSPVAAGAPGFNLVVNGTGFVSTSTVQWNGSPRTTTFVSTTQLLAAISAWDVATAGSAAAISVLSPPAGSEGGGGGTSGTVSLPIVSPGTSGYAFNSVITIHSAQVVATEQNFPVLITTGLGSLLATAANGGLIQNTTVLNAQVVPADLVFTSDAAGANLLSWEVASYAPTTGQIEIWVRIPTLLSNTNDTTIYMWYGNPAVATYQCTASTTWDPNFAAVYHFGGGSTLSLTDSTINGYNLTNFNATTASGQIGGAFSAITGEANTNSIGLPTGSAPRTVEAWINPNAANNVGNVFGFGSFSIPFSSFALAVVAPGSAGVSLEDASVTVPLTVDGNWHHWVGELASGTTVSAIQLYLDGVAKTPTYSGGTNTVNTITNNGGTGLIQAGRFGGLVDEARISTIARPSDWIATEYNNQLSPTTFYSISQPTEPLITGISPSSAGVGTTVTISGLNFGTTPGASTVTFNMTPAVPVTWSQTSITIAVPNGATTGNVVVTVNNTSSNPVPFTVVPPNPTPVLNSITPPSLAAASAGQTLTLTGSGFISTSQALWNGASRSTTYSNNTELTIAVTDADLFNPGTASVTVLNPAPGGGSSNSVPFTVSGNADPVTCTVASGTAVTSCGSRPGLSALRTAFDGNLLLDTISWVANPPDEPSGNCAGGPCYYNPDWFSPVTLATYGTNPGATNGTGFTLGQVVNYGSYPYLLYAINSFLGLPSGANSANNILTTTGQDLQGLALTFDTSSTNAPNTNAGIYGVGFDFQLSVSGCAPGTSGPGCPPAPAQAGTYTVTFQVYGATPGCSSNLTNYNLASMDDNGAILDCFDYSTGVTTSPGSTGGDFTNGTGTITSGTDGGTGAGPLLATVTMTSTNGTPGFFGITTSSPIGAIHASASGVTGGTIGAFGIDNIDILGAGPSYQLTTAANPPAEGTVTPASSTYPAGTVVNVTATPNPGYQFVNWSGPVLNPSVAQTAVTMNAVASITANFQAVPTVSITVNTSPAGLSFAVDGTSYTSSQTFTWAVNSQHTLSTTTIQANGSGSQYALSAWSPGNPTPTHVITVPSSNTTYIATFVMQYQLTNTASPANEGSVFPVSGSWFNAGAVVNISAFPFNGFGFQNWTGPVANSSAANTTVTISGPTTITANFGTAAPNTYTVATSQPGLSFSVDGTTYTSSQIFTWATGSSHTIATTSPQAAITAGTRYVFNYWSDSGAQSHTITATSSTTTYTAIFATQYQLTIAASPSADGTVTPASGGWYNAGSVVSVSGSANSGYGFLNWMGSVANPNAAATTVTMSAPMTVTANFGPNVTVTTSTAGPSFSVDGTAFTSSQTFTWVSGSSHTIATTSPQAGTTGTQYVFTSWNDNGLLSHTVTATSSPATYTANFNTQYQLTTVASPAADGYVTPTSGHWYDAGTPVGVFAGWNTGYIFTNWSIMGGTLSNVNFNVASVTMNAPITVTAAFIQAPNLTLSSPTIMGSFPGPQTWTYTLTNNGTIAATNVQITDFEVAQQQHTGTLCTPSVTTTFPLSAASSIDAGATSPSFSITINFTGCVSTAEFQGLIAWQYSSSLGGPYSTQERFKGLQ